MEQTIQILHLSSANQALINRRQKTIESKKTELQTTKNGAKLLLLSLTAVATGVVAGIAICKHKNTKKAQNEALRQIENFKNLISKAKTTSFREFEQLGKNFSFASEQQNREFLSILYAKAEQENDFIYQQLHEFGPLVGFEGRVSGAYQNAIRILKLLDNGEIKQGDIFDDTSMQNSINFVRHIEINETKIPELSESSIQKCMDTKISLETIRKAINQNTAYIKTQESDNFGDPACFCLKTKDLLAELINAFDEKNPDKFVAVTKKIKKTLNDNFYTFEWFNREMPEGQRIGDFCYNALVDLPAIYKTKNEAHVCITPGYCVDK